MRLNDILNEKAVSKAQRRFFGMAAAVKSGDKPASDFGPGVGKLAKSLSKKEIDKFAKTKEKNLPAKKTKEAIEEAVSNNPSVLLGQLQNIMSHLSEDFDEINWGPAMDIGEEDYDEKAVKKVMPILKQINTDLMGLEKLINKLRSYGML